MERGTGGRCHWHMRLRTAIGWMALATALTLAAITPAAAKGVSKGLIEGEGLTTPITLMGGGKGVPYAENMADVWRDFGLYPAVFGFPGTPEGQPATLLEQAPTAELGPELTVTWTAIGPDGERDVTQELYPYAESGPLLHTEAGQPAVGDHVTPGGWFEAPDSLVTNLRTLGVPERSTFLGAVSDPEAVRDETSSSPAWVITTALLVVAAVVVLGTLSAFRRRRVPPAVT